MVNHVVGETLRGMLWVVVAEGEAAVPPCILVFRIGTEYVNE